MNAIADYHNKVHPDAEIPLVSDETNALLLSNPDVNVIADAQQKDFSEMIDRVVDHLNPILVANDIYSVRSTPELIDVDKTYAVFDKVMAASPEKYALKDFPNTLRLRRSNDTPEDDTMECAVISPSSYGEHTDESFKKEYFEKISNGDPIIDSTVKAFFDYHELKHCLTGSVKHGPIAIDVKNSFHDFPEKNPDIASQFDKIEDPGLRSNKYNNFYNVTGALVDESLSDVFSALKVQQEYFLENKADILNGEKPLINPVLPKISALRSEYAYKDIFHDTSIPFNRVLNLLSDFHNNEKLLSSSDIELNATSYKIADDCFPEMVAQTGRYLFPDMKDTFNKGVNIDFSKNYEQYFEFGKPIFEESKGQISLLKQNNAIVFNSNIENIGKIVPAQPEENNGITLN